MNNTVTKGNNKSPPISPLGWIVSALAFLYVLSIYTINYFINWSRVSLALATGLALAVVLQTTVGRNRRFSLIVLAPLLFFAYVCLSTSWATDSDLAYYSAGMTLTAMLGGVAIWQARNQGMPWGVVAWATLIGSGILVLTSWGEVKTLSEGERAAGVTGNANQLALCLSYSAMISWFAPRKMSKWMHLAGAFFFSYGVLVSGSRKALVILAIVIFALAFWLLARIRKPSTWAMIAGAGVGIFLTGVYIKNHNIDVVDRISSISVVQRTLNIFLQRKMESSASGRIELIESGLEVWEKNPLFGAGVGQMEVVSGTGEYAHNNYVEVLADYGIVGFFLYYVPWVFLFFMAMYQGFRHHSPPHYRAMVFFLMFFVLDFAMVTYMSKVSWVMIAMAASLLTASNIKDKRKVQNQLQIDQRLAPAIPKI